MIKLLVSKTAFGGQAVQGGESLASLGYADVGIDEGWEGCGEGVNGTQHDASGAPVIHAPSFPDMKGLVDAAHSSNLTMGWYQNGCACGELLEKEINYAGDVRSAYNFELRVRWDEIRWLRRPKQPYVVRVAFDNLLLIYQPRIAIPCNKPQQSESSLPAGIQNKMLVCT